MFSGFIRHLRVATIAVAVIGAGSALPGDIAAADPHQDQEFFDLLGEKDIPPVDGENGLVTTAHSYRPPEPGGLPVTSRRVLLTSFVGPLPAGEIAPTNPLPVPAQQLPPPQEVQPAPQGPPAPPPRVQKVPQQAPKQVEPPPEEAPPAEAPPPPQVEAPAPAAPAPPPPEPPPQRPDQPSPPGHVRLAP